MENPKCPICHQPMALYSNDISLSRKTGQQYMRTRYKCVQDDTWAKLEVPKLSIVEAEETASV